MFKNVAIFFFFFCLISFPLFAFDSGEFEKSLRDFSDQISQTAYAISEKSDSAENQALEGALDRTDKAQKDLSAVMNKISNKKDFEAAESILRQFAEKSKLERDKIQIIENYISPYKNKAENAKKLLQMVKTLHNNNF